MHPQGCEPTVSRSSTLSIRMHVPGVERTTAGWLPNRGAPRKDAREERLIDLPCRRKQPSTAFPRIDSYYAALPIL
jgi:hypothetical protein